MGYRGAGWVALALGAVACGPTVSVAEGSSSSGGDSTGTVSMSASTTASSTATSSTAVTTDDPTAEEGPIDSDFGRLPDFGTVCGNCGEVDVLLVVDNSRTMGEEQRALARAMVGWVGQVLVEEENYDVQVMVTTTDMGNPVCTPFQHPGYEPAEGAPVATGCNSRIDDFVGLGPDPLQMPEVCTAVCPADVTPADPFVAFGRNGTNVPEVPDADVDGDGVLDSPVAQALGCLVPQGIDGCGYESPLEAMLQALNPDAPWNGGDRPFLRPSAALVIIVLTDESDCSIDDFSIMEDPAWWNTNPGTGLPAPSSALCWNAGVSCDGPDADGVFSNCAVATGTPLEEVSRYTDYLRGQLVDVQHKPIEFFAINGVPAVTDYDDTPPYAPIAGGELDLLVRQWRDGPYPSGDILPDDVDAGVTAQDKTFELGIGPSCTGQTMSGEFTGQAVPNLRLLEVCHALDDDARGQPHCFVDSVCSESYAPILNTVWGRMQSL
jgi:hypothetical protein